MAGCLEQERVVENALCQRRFVHRCVGGPAVGHYTFVGCDAHNKTLLLKVAMDREASRQRSFANTRSGRKALVCWLLGVAREAGASTAYVVYEASGLGFTLYDELTAAGVRCSVLAPTKIARSPQHRRRKCDAKDAERLLDIVRAHVLAGSELPAVWVPGHEVRDAREVVRGRLAVAKRLTAAKTEVRSLLTRRGVERPKRLGKGWSKAFRAWLSGLVEGHGPLLWGARVLLASLMAQVEFLEGELHYFDEQVMVLAHQERHAAAVEAMTSVKGVGELTALAVLTELGDVRRFSRRGQVAAYAGLVPRTDESGEAADHKGHITKQGPSRLRGVLSQAAHSWVRWDPAAKAAYERLVARNPKHKKIALVAMMRRLLIRLWHRGVDALRASPCPGSAAEPDGAAGVRR